MTPKEKLKEAVEAMRNITAMSAAKWEETYPTFHKASRNSTFQPGAAVTQWDRQLYAMNTELQLRIAEVLLTS
jgi:hypothetical protein